MAAENLYTADNPVFAGYCFYAAVLVVKVLIMAPLTARQRMRKAVFANAEDTSLIKGSKVKFDDVDVERVRRAHLNDLENILPFLILALVYIGTNPNATWAMLLFRVFTACRIAHTIVYAVIVLPQPSRAVAFMGGVVVNLYMAIAVLMTFISNM